MQRTWCGLMPERTLERSAASWLRWLALGLNAPLWITATLACQSAPTPSVAAGPQTHPSAASSLQTTHSAEPTAPASAAQDRIDELLSRVAARRQLAPKRKVTAKYVERPALVNHARSQMRRDGAGSVVQGYEALLCGLGLVPLEFRLEDSLSLLWRATLAGVYDPDLDTLLVATDLDPNDFERTLAHELVHALQAQHFGLKGRLDPKADMTDRQSALQALAEGDATCAAETICPEQPAIAALGCSGGQVGPDSTQVPCVVARSLMAPYVDGVNLVRTLRARGGWEAVNALWRDVPTTTEQVLHLDKLASREPAEAVPVPLPRSGGGAPFYRDILGEQTLRLVLQEWLPAAEAAEVAAGWGGDRVAAYRSDDRREVAWRVRFTSADQAARASNALARGLVHDEIGEGGGDEDGVAERTPLVSGKRQTVRCRRRADRGPVAVGSQGRDIVVALGPLWLSRQGPAPEQDCAGTVAWAKRVLGQN